LCVAGSAFGRSGANLSDRINAEGRYRLSNDRNWWRRNRDNITVGLLLAVVGGVIAVLLAAAAERL